MARSQTKRSSPRLSDEELDYYGDLYVRHMLRDAGVEFESFLIDPDYYLRKHASKRQVAGGEDGAGGSKGLRSFLRRHRSGRGRSG